jgi:hypothetical protein
MGVYAIFFSSTIILPTVTNEKCHWQVKIRDKETKKVKKALIDVRKAVISDFILAEESH